MPANDSIRSPLDRAVPSDTTIAVVALGCLWGADPVFGGRDGVVRTCVGFAGGTTPNPTHSAIGDHVEAVRVAFAPDQLSYRELLNHFWTHHDPAQTPAKRRYAHALFPQTAAQSDLARASRAAEEERHDDTQRSTSLRRRRFPRPLSITRTTSSAATALSCQRFGDGCRVTRPLLVLRQPPLRTRTLPDTGRPTAWIRIGTALACRQTPSRPSAALPGGITGGVPTSTRSSRRRFEAAPALLNARSTSSYRTAVAIRASPGGSGSTVRQRHDARVLGRLQL
ncbi:hypothetical protein BSZ35_08865 [Salinibacter sp. 10B]|nr:hypothetical protein BSZ35_08865 [Salinibacter sp. 10B]